MTVAGDISAGARGYRYEIREYAPRFKRQLAELLAHLWDGDVSVNLAHLEWKYERNPYSSRPLITLGLCEGQVVGMRGWFGARWEAEGRQWFIPCGADACVAPEHRKYGLFTELHRAGLNELDDLECPFALSLSAAPVAYRVLSKLGWREIGSLGVLRWLPTGHASWLGRLEQGARKLGTLRALYRMLRRHVGRFGLGDHIGGGSVFAALDGGPAPEPLALGSQPRPRDMAELVSRALPDGRIRHVRDPAYFEWRYRNPRSQYRFLYWGEPNLEGYLVLRAPRIALRREVQIVDWEAQDEETALALLSAALGLGAFRQVRIWSGMLTADRRRFLDEAGFEPAPELTQLGGAPAAALVRPPPGVAQVGEWALGTLRVLDPANWDIRMIDSDAG